MAVKKQLVSSISLSLKSHTAWDRAISSISLEVRGLHFHDHTINDRAAIGIDWYDVDIPIRYGNEGDAPFFGNDHAKKWRKVGVR